MSNLPSRVKTRRGSEPSTKTFHFMTTFIKRFVILSQIFAVQFRWNFLPDIGTATSHGAPAGHVEPLNRPPVCEAEFAPTGKRYVFTT